ILFMSSWYDAYVASTLQNYQALTPGRATTLIMGPWTHGNRSQRVFGDVDFGPAAPFDGHVDEDWLTYRLRFFDRWLKGNDTAPERRQEGRVHLFLMGGGSGRRTAEGHLDHGGRWIESTAWPVPQAKP